MEKNGIYLSGKGKKQFIQEFERKLYQKIQIDGCDRTYDFVIKSEIQKLKKFIETGEKYKPYKYVWKAKMFVILVYDVKAKRNNKILKTCRKYLRHVQKSVFEGNLTEAKLKRLKNELKKISNEKEDSIIIYRFETLKYSSKEVLGTYEEDSVFL